MTELLQRSALEAGKAATAAGLTLRARHLRGAARAATSTATPERLAQVFDNLFSNAIKYTPAAGTSRSA